MKKHSSGSLIIFFLLFYAGLFSQDKRGIYVWPATFYESGGIENVINTLSENKITDIFLLVKGEAGYTLFPSDYSYKDFYKQIKDTIRDEKFKERYNFLTDTTLIDKVIDLAHKKKIKVHAWFIVSGDRHFVELNPGSEVVQVPKPDVWKYPHPLFEKGNINLLYPTYKQYLLSLIRRSLEYPFDGIMLDKIRYTNLIYTWDEIHVSKALRSNINIDKLIDCAITTMYGKDEEKELFFKKYRDGDKDARGWIKIKKEDVEEYVKDISKITKEKNIELSASFMPEGAYDEDFADVHYAQNYRELSRYLDYIVIMAYAKSYRKPPTWVKMVTANAKEKSSCKIWAAIQCFDSVSSEFIFDQVKNGRIANADGIAIFRFGEVTPERWKAFNEGMNLKIDKAIKSQINGILYNGPGTIINCCTKSMETLLKSENIIPILLKENALKDLNNFSNKKFVLMPGGSGTAEAEALGIDGLSNIEKFVSSGGGYVGICAGAYLPIKGYNGNLTERLQIVNAAALDIEHWNRGNGKVKLEITKGHPIFSEIKDKSFELNYFSGPVLIPADLKLPQYKELAIFRTDYHENGATEGDMLNKTAILEAKFQKGKIILFSPHPELTPEMESLLINSINYVAKEK